MIRLLTNRRRLIRKKMYRSPHERSSRNTYFRENKQLNKNFQSDYINKEKVYTKRRPKRETLSGFKMSYRYKYYNKEKPEEEEDEES